MLIMNADQIRQAEKTYISEAGDNGLELMHKAGQAVADAVVCGRQVDGRRIVVLCGNGNNGGDGYAVAALLAGLGADVFICEPSGLPRSDISAYFRSQAAPIVQFCPISEIYDITAGADIIIDALFGIGFHGTLEGNIAVLVAECNRSGAVKYAIDVPSGILSDSGELGGVCFKADVTVTFSAYKQCFALLPAARYCGKVIFADIGIPHAVLRESGTVANVIDKGFVLSSLPVRGRFSNKFDFGRVFMFCGSYGMAGAAVIAARSAYRSGTGIVDLAVPSSIYPIVSSGVPEAVFCPFENLDGESTVSALMKRVFKADAALIGCGIGNGKDTAATVRKLICQTSRPTVIDADGINSLSSDIDIFEQVDATLILTPHTGEMARLTGLSAAEIESDRINVAVRFAKKLNAVIVLKGAKTVVASPDGRVSVNMTAGNPGMATAGSGDMLAGIICALLAGGVEPYAAAASAVFLHAKAGDAAAQRLSATSMTASDMIEELAHLFTKYERLD